MVKSTKYEKPGQKRPTPPITDPLYRFYTSTLKQKKDSPMAIKWCLEHGVFSKEKAARYMMVLEMKDLGIKENKMSKKVKKNDADSVE
jgi:hypothetical protein